MILPSISLASPKRDFDLLDFERLIKPLLEREPLELDDADEMELDDEIDEIRSEREEAVKENQRAKEEQK